MNVDLNTYVILVGAGFVLIAAEMFIPGAVLGIIGIVALLVAAILGFVVFGAAGGLFSAVGLLVGGSIFLGLWMKYCPKSFFGKWFTLQEDGKDFKSFDNHLDALAGKSGTAHTDLRPSGIAIIDQQRIDVMTESGFVSRGTPVKVIHVTGGRVVVRPITPS